MTDQEVALIRRHVETIRALDRYRHLRPPPRQVARKAHARADGPTRRGARGTRRGGHPGVRRARATERVEPLGSVLVCSEAAPAAGAFPGRDSLRRKEACWNRHN